MRLGVGVPWSLPPHLHLPGDPAPSEAALVRSRLHAPQIALANDWPPTVQG